MSLRSDPRVVRSEEWPFQRIGDELIVVLPRKRVMHRLEGVGVRVWELLERPHSVAELVAALEREYEVDAGTLRADVDAFLARLQELELLKVAS